MNVDWMNFMNRRAAPVCPTRNIVSMDIEASRSQQKR